jgi:DNA (cytosine-5)-methyltransferase 1
VKVLSLFSGVGGLDLGFEWAGFETVCFCEIEEFPRKVLNKHWPNVPIIEDVRNVTKESVPRVDVIIGGFPCQDISYAGKGAGIDYDLSEQEGTRSGLWWEYWRTIRELRPRYVVAENVSALTNRGLDIVLGSLAQIGYDAEWQIVSAAGVGAAHIRERIFIVAYPEHGGVSVGRGADGFVEYVRNEGGIRKNDFGQGEQEKTREALADPNGGRPSGSGGYVNAKYSEDKENREVGGAFDERGQNQPDWFGGLQSQPHPVSFKNVEHPERKRSGRRGYELAESVEGEGGASRLLRGMEIEYDFRGVAYGVSDRVGALKGYGNAVVPQVAYLVAMAVRQHAEENGLWE